MNRSLRSTALGAFVAGLLLPASLPAQEDAPPRERGPFRRPELVELIRMDPALRLDIRYATKNNFSGQAVYSEARAFLQRPAALALMRAHRKLQRLGYGIIIFDGYRPWSVTKMFWDITPSGKKNFVANPKKGSRHNRGCAVDLTICDLKTGLPVAMTSGYDEFSKRAAVDYPGGTVEERRNRDLLRSVMESEGFTPHPDEWWHYDFEAWTEYPILNIPFSEIGKAEAAGAGATPVAPHPAAPANPAAALRPAATSAF